MTHTDWTQHYVVHTRAQWASGVRGGKSCGSSSDVGKLVYSVRCYAYSADEDTSQRSRHIPEHILTRCWRRQLKHESHCHGSTVSISKRLHFKKGKIVHWQTSMLCALLQKYIAAWFILRITRHFLSNVAFVSSVILIVADALTDYFNADRLGDSRKESISSVCDEFGNN